MLKLLLLIDRGWPLTLLATLVTVAAWLRALTAGPVRMPEAAAGRLRRAAPTSAI